MFVFNFIFHFSFFIFHFSFFIFHFSFFIFHFSFFIFYFFFFIFFFLFFIFHFHFHFSFFIFIFISFSFCIILLFPAGNADDHDNKLPSDDEGSDIFGSIETSGPFRVAGGARQHRHFLAQQLCPRAKHSRSDFLEALQLCSALVLLVLAGTQNPISFGPHKIK